MTIDPEVERLIAEGWSFSLGYYHGPETLGWHCCLHKTGTSFWHDVHNCRTAQDAVDVAVASVVKPPFDLKGTSVGGGER